MLTDLIKRAGVVGAGGAGFPTHVKLDAKADCLIVNAAECEPLIETDKYLCRTYSEEIIDAARRVGAHLGAGRIVIALKRKYTREIEALGRAIHARGAPVELFLMDAFYPAGDEQIIVQLVCGRPVPERGIPLAVGAVVDNVGTMVGIHDALQGTPVTEKYLSVTGAVERPVMLKVPLGTPVLDCVRAARPAAQAYDLIVGGPMMGRVCTDAGRIAALRVLKTTGNLLLLPKGHPLTARAEKPLRRVIRQAQSACLQCRMCTEQCPRYRTGHRIRPHLVMRSVFLEYLTEDRDKYERMYGDAANCSECGLCELYACPMGLSPRRVNAFLKGRLRDLGIDVPKNPAPEVRESILSGKASTSRLEARLGLREYARRHAGDECLTLEPERVTLPFSQHIGRPAVPVKKKGARVEKGELLAQAPEGALSAHLHASIGGVIESIDEQCAVIRRES
ncbi:MAG: 4Fe-4S dicluster domain-containing protein [Oscillospiraceae bacterium]|jgi:Na+-translocating ferredoxin:NAD+ oxidoreductase RnfC subunit|nr:4Fe-4S dicluster domain-containing protein [Oscillospiraceae bacterium]